MIAKALMERCNFLEFEYLKLYLVQNSKDALRWFEPPSTKENFVLQWKTIRSISDSEAEAIFSALLAHHLLESESNILFKISKMGKEFLKHIDSPR